MRGHEEIIKMRMQGYAPDYINLDDFAKPNRMIDWQKKFDESFTPIVCVSGDQIEMLDLRFLVNLTVNITSENEQRAKKLFDRAKKAGAKTVIAGYIVIKGESGKTEWMESWHS
jgi:hypothetical protein